MFIIQLVSLEAVPGDPMGFTDLFRPTHPIPWTSLWIREFGAHTWRYLPTLYIHLCSSRRTRELRLRSTHFRLTYIRFFILPAN